MSTAGIAQQIADEDRDLEAVFARNPEFYSCRMYENRFPEVDDLVVVIVKSVTDMGAYVQLSEYNNAEGMILSTELSRRRIRSINKLIRVGRQEVVVVLRVDKEKGYIDLSKRRVSPQEITMTEERYNKSKAAHSIMRHLAEMRQIPLEQLLQAHVWPLYKKFGHAYDAFKLAITEPQKVWDGVDVPEPPKEVMEDLLKLIRRRLTPQPVKIRADIEVSCFKYDGIEYIKEALSAGEAMSTEAAPVIIKLVAPPLFVMFTTSIEKNVGIQVLNQAIEKVRQEILKRGGELVVKNAPRSISEREETDFLADMENQEDEDNSDEDSDSEEDSSEDEEEEAPKKKSSASKKK
jgi:translation initiation factor 2 subunit 1